MQVCPLHEIFPEGFSNNNGKIHDKIYAVLDRFSDDSQCVMLLRRGFPLNPNLNTASHPRADYTVIFRDQVFHTQYDMGRSVRNQGCTWGSDVLNHNNYCECS